MLCTFMHAKGTRDKGGGPYAVSVIWMPSVLLGFESVAIPTCPTPNHWALEEIFMEGMLDTWDLV